MSCAIPLLFPHELQRAALTLAAEALRLLTVDLNERADAEAELAEIEEQARWLNVLWPTPDEPSSALQETSDLYPDIEWLAHLEPAQRCWYFKSPRRELLRRRFQGVPEYAWHVLESGQAHGA